MCPLTNDLSVGPLLAMPARGLAVVSPCTTPRLQEAVGEEVGVEGIGWSRRRIRDMGRGAQKEPTKSSRLQDCPAEKKGQNCGRSLTGRRTAFLAERESARSRCYVYTPKPGPCETKLGRDESKVAPFGSDCKHPVRPKAVLLPPKVFCWL